MPTLNKAFSFTVNEEGWTAPYYTSSGSVDGGKFKFYINSYNAGSDITIVWTGSLSTFGLPSGKRASKLSLVSAGISARNPGRIAATAKIYKPASPGTYIDQYIINYDNGLMWSSNEGDIFYYFGNNDLNIPAVQNSNTWGYPTDMLELTIVCTADQIVSTPVHIGFDEIRYALTYDDQPSSTYAGSFRQILKKILLTTASVYTNNNTSTISGSSSLSYDNVTIFGPTLLNVNGLLDLRNNRGAIVFTDIQDSGEADPIIYNIHRLVNGNIEHPAFFEIMHYPVVNTRSNTSFYPLTIGSNLIRCNVTNPNTFLDVAANDEVILASNGMIGGRFEINRVLETSINSSVITIKLKYPIKSDTYTYISNKAHSFKPIYLPGGSVYDIRVAGTSAVNTNSYARSVAQVYRWDSVRG